MDIWSLWGPMHLSAVDIKKFGILRHSILYGVREIWMSRKVLTLELNDQIKTKCQIHAITSNNSYRWKIGLFTHSLSYPQSRDAITFKNIDKPDQFL